MPARRVLVLREMDGPDDRGLLARHTPTSLVVLAMLLSVAATTAAQSEPPPRYDPVWHTAIAAGGFIGAGLIEWLEQHADHTCKWCGANDNGAPDVPAIDNWAHTHWRWTNEAAPPRSVSTPQAPPMRGPSSPCQPPWRHRQDWGRDFTVDAQQHRRRATGDWPLEARVPAVPPQRGVRRRSDRCSR